VPRYWLRPLLACETDPMGRWNAGATVAAAVVLAAGLAGGPGAAAVAAQPTPTPTPGAEPAEPVPGEPLCTIADPRLVELSGLVALDDGYLAVNDSTLFEDRLPIFFLDPACNVTGEQSYLPGRPRDPEDMALDRQANVVWVGDIGDNPAAGTGEGEPRPSVAFWRVDLAGDRTPVIHRFTYPDGQPRDAEALLLDGDGTPIIVTKSATGTAELFRPQELRPSSAPEDTVPLEAVGEVTLPQPETEVEHRLGAVARQAVTGGANAPDGSAVALRSYTDAFEYDVVDGDVIGALTAGQPRITPLPGEPLGEAITYSPDGQRFLTVSEVPDEDTSYVPTILGYTPTAPPPPEPPAEPAPAAAGGGGLFNDLQDIINVIVAVGIIGLVLVGAGVFGIVRARRAGSGGAARDGGDPAGGDGAGPVSPATGRARLPGSPGVAAVPPPGGGPEPPAGQAAGVYTSSAARPAGTEYRGTEYGGGRPYQAGAEYGGAGPPGDGYGEAGYHPADYGPAGDDDPGYGEAGYGQAGHGEASYGQAGHGQPGHGQAGYGEAGYGQAGHGEAGYGQAGHGEAGYGQPGYGQAGDGEAGYGQAGYGHQGYSQAGYPAGPGAAGYPPEAGYPPDDGYGRADQAGYGGYPAGGRPEPYDQDWPNGYPPPPADGREYAGGAHHAGPDYYSDDPDYPYEFRDRNR